MELLLAGYFGALANGAVKLSAGYRRGYVSGVLPDSSVREGESGSIQCECLQPLDAGEHRVEVIREWRRLALRRITAERARGSLRIW